MRVVEIDLFGVVYGAQAARPAIKRAGGGAIVVTASLAGLSPMAGDPGYSVAKGGAIAFVRSMAPRLAAEGTTITAICPGFADTAIIDRIRDQFTAANFPVLTAEEVADAMVDGLDVGRAGRRLRHPARRRRGALQVQGRAVGEDRERRDRRRPGGAAPAVDALTRPVKQLPLDDPPSVRPSLSTPPRGRRGVRRWRPVHHRRRRGLLADPDWREVQARTALSR